MKNHPSKSGKGPRRDPSKEKFWRRVLSEQADGGRDVRAFCRARGLAETSFYAWRRTIAARDRRGAVRTPRRPTFVELRPREAAPQVSVAPLEIVVGSRRLLVRAGCDGALLREVLAALGE